MGAALIVIVSFAMASLNVPMRKSAWEPDKLKAPHIYTLGVFTCGNLLLGVLSCFFCRGKTPKVLPLVPVVVAITTSILVWAYLKYDVAPMWLIIFCAFLNVVGLIVVGYQIDKLSTIVGVDEYMQPVVVMWCEVLLVLILMALVIQITFTEGCIEGGGVGACDCK